MDDLTDLWLEEPLNLDALDLDFLLDNLAALLGLRVRREKEPLFASTCRVPLRQ